MPVGSAIAKRSNSNVSLFFPDKPAPFAFRPSDDTSNDGGMAPSSLTSSIPTQSTDIRSFVQSYCPSLQKNFTPSWWLPGGHLQTIYCVAGDFSKVDQVVYKRTFLRFPDGGTIGLDFTGSEDESNPETPIVVVLHGLTGGSHESYVRAILSRTTFPKSEGGLGYRGVVVNSRGCAGVPLTSPQLYSAGHTDDIRAAMLYISDLYPKAPILGVGFSLGASVLARYIGEEGDMCRMTAGCILGCPWDLVKNCEPLETEFISRNVYSKAMGSNLVKMFCRHIKAMNSFSDSIAAPHIDKLLALKAPTVKNFDDCMTRLIGGSSPPFPFPSADAYYEWASSHRSLKDIRRPFLALNARDDPIVMYQPIKEVEEESQWVTLAITQHGGHLGWFEGGNVGGLRGRYPDRWFKEAVAEWCKATAEELGSVERFMSSQGKQGWKAREKEMHGEFRVEQGRPNVGYKVLSDMEGVVVGTEGEGGLLAGL